MLCVKAVFIDVDNTLLDFDACAKGAAVYALNAHGVPEAAFDFATFKRINDRLWSDLEEGKIEREEIHRTRWTKIFAELGIELDGKAFEAEFLDAIFHAITPVKGAGELLADLSGKYPVYAATNAPHVQQLKRLESAGFLPYFTDVFTSERMGAPKPEAAFFDACFATLNGIEPNEVVMIGDSMTADILGAHAAGLQTIYFNFRKAPVPKDCPTPYVADTLDEIRAWL